MGRVVRNRRRVQLVGRDAHHNAVHHFADSRFESHGKALEFALVTGADYEVRRDGRLLLATDHIDVVRDFSFNADQVLAKDVEEARLQAFIQSEIAELILLRLEMRLKSITPPPVPVPPPATSPGA